MHNAALKVNKLCQTLNAEVSLFECHYLSHQSVTEISRENEGFLCCFFNINMLHDASLYKLSYNKIHLFKRYTRRHPRLTSVSKLLVKCCTDKCLLPSKTLCLLTRMLN